MIKALTPNCTVTFDYTNYRGKKEIRKVVYNCLQLGNNEYHEKKQWFLNGTCMERKAVRSFALSDIDMETFEIIHI